MFVGTNLETSVKERRGLHLQISNSNKKKKKKKSFAFHIIGLRMSWFNGPFMNALLWRWVREKIQKFGFSLKGKMPHFSLQMLVGFLDLFMCQRDHFFFGIHIYIYIYACKLEKI